MNKKCGFGWENYMDLEGFIHTKLGIFITKKHILYKMRFHSENHGRTWLCFLGLRYGWYNNPPRKHMGCS
jgi:hypothetical protein